ncbi:MAG: cytochrome bd oxidase small subunit CydS [Bacillota bacterium]
MSDFLIFYAPFLVIILAIAFGFWISLKDGPISKNR